MTTTALNPSTAVESPASSASVPPQAAPAPARPRSPRALRSWGPPLIVFAIMIGAWYFVSDVVLDVVLRKLREATGEPKGVFIGVPIVGTVVALRRCWRGRWGRCRCAHWCRDCRAPLR